MIYLLERVKKGIISYQNHGRRYVFFLIFLLLDPRRSRDVVSDNMLFELDLFPI